MIFFPCRKQVFLSLCRKIVIFAIPAVCLFFSSSGVWAQSAEETLLTAEKLMLRGKRDTAVNLYRRALFFTPKKKAGYAWQKAAFTADRANEFRIVREFADSALVHIPLSDTAAYRESLFLKAKALLMLHENRQALELLLSRQAFYNPETTARAALLWGIAYLENEQFAKAREAFSFLFSDAEERKHCELNRLFSDSSVFQKPRSETARILSTIIPGGGQLYAGYPEEALNSFVLNASLFVLLYRFSADYSWYNAWLSIYPWYERYYSSNILRASRLAEEKRKLKRQALISRIIDLADF